MGFMLLLLLLEKILVAVFFPLKIAPKVAILLSKKRKKN